MPSQVPRSGRFRSRDERMAGSLPPAGVPSPPPPPDAGSLCGVHQCGLEVGRRMNSSRFTFRCRRGPLPILGAALVAYLIDPGLDLLMVHRPRTEGRDSGEGVSMVAAGTWKFGLGWLGRDQAE
ncbi:hypothetical protein GGTG_13887 [Gaeumannomyces tritici R3-111a-1]|uniref:Uncharacterized protein n=1 Tax=Gaeumannomyces tritici (strain R3-111a-1) TaxID=644352 RepID=J3PK42_GAET3|nr:hypothetical protein GGTG_13887 [Gaeumannomyces tritici R3-111a-1]EJT68543.1 hypothetical protein GGTG_13887 [Gaeumannomyces tritici R3-111a-1]